MSVETENRMLLPGEEIHDLQLRGLRLIQPTTGYRFSMDSVLLADFAALSRRARTADLGAGSGVLSFLLYGRNPDLTIDALEVNPKAAERMRRSVLLNDLAEHIRVTEGDIKRVRAYFPPEQCDAVVCNPPYYPKEQAVFMREDLRQSRSETGCAYPDVCEAAFYLLKNRGRFITMCPAARLFDMSSAMQARRLAPRRLRMVRPLADRAPYLCLIEAVKNGGPGVQIWPDLIVQNGDGQYTDEVKKLYHMEEV